MTFLDALRGAWTANAQQGEPCVGRTAPGHAGGEVRALRFESRLAESVASKKAPRTIRKTYAILVGIVFIFLTLTSSATAVPQSVIHVGTNDSLARYVGLFEDKSNVVTVGVFSVDDWVCIKVPFKGRISDIKSISFSSFITQSGDAQHEPYVMLKLPEGKSLICHPESSYSGGEWSFQTMTWQSRDVVAQGKWVVAPVKTESMLAPLSMWLTMIGDRSVISVSVYVGCWDIAGEYQCYLGDFSINGIVIDFANMARKAGTTLECPILI
jgi:hypothetical protein